MYSKELVLKLVLGFNFVRLKEGFSANLDGFGSTLGFRDGLTGRFVIGVIVVFRVGVTGRFVTEGDTLGFRDGRTGCVVVARVGFNVFVLLCGFKGGDRLSSWLLPLSSQFRIRLDSK
jgi:hypothetical protein